MRCNELAEREDNNEQKLCHSIVTVAHGRKELIIISALEMFPCNIRYCILIVMGCLAILIYTMLLVDMSVSYCACSEAEAALYVQKPPVSRL